MKGLSGRCLSEFIDWRYSQSCLYFLPSFVKCCPSNLLSGSTLFPSPPSLCEKVYCLHLYSVKGGGVNGFWASDRKPLPQSPFTGQFFRLQHYALPSISLIFLLHKCMHIRRSRNPLSPQHHMPPQLSVL